MFLGACEKKKVVWWLDECGSPEKCHFACFAGNTCVCVLVCLFVSLEPNLRSLLK